MFEGPLTESILKRAQENELLHIALHNIRDYTSDKHHVTDEPPFGGGGGMLMKVEPLVTAVETILHDHPQNEAPNSDNTNNAAIPVILTTPKGRLFTQADAQKLATYPRIAIICGRYEGIDERVRQLVVTDEISIGDYVLTGGELPAMVIIDALARNIPGVLGAADAATNDSHATGLLEHALYTRPPSFRGLDVPPELLKGDHAAIERWRRRDAIWRTWERRPDLLIHAPLSDDERYYLARLARTDEPPHNA